MSVVSLFQQARAGLACAHAGENLSFEQKCRFLDQSVAVTATSTPSTGPVSPSSGADRPDPEPGAFPPTRDPAGRGRLGTSRPPFLTLVSRGHARTGPLEGESSAPVLHLVTPAAPRAPTGHPPAAGGHPPDAGWVRRIRLVIGQLLHLAPPSPVDQVGGRPL